MGIRHAKDRVYEIMGIPADQRGTTYTVHHIVTKDDYRQNQDLWDRSVPSGKFEISGPSNLFPIRVEQHKELHLRIERQEKPRH